MWIKFNKKQQDHLIILMKEFFPEYNEFRIGSVSGIGDKQKNKSTHQFMWMEKNFKYHHDDWIDRDETQVVGIYELCLTELPKRIAKKLWFKGIEWLTDNSVNPYICHPYVEGEFEDNLQVNIIQSKHPVDFLYKFVKDCKKNKYFKK